MFQMLQILDTTIMCHFIKYNNKMLPLVLEVMLACLVILVIPPCDDLKISFVHVYSTAGQFKNAITQLSNTDIEGGLRSPIPASYYGVISHSAPIGGIQVFASHTHLNKPKQMCP